MVVGETRPELAGSALSARFPKSVEASPSQTPHVDAQEDLKTCRAILKLIENGLVDAVHDCSSGGLGVALAEMAISGSLGAKVDLALVPSSCHRSLETAFSESHGRFVVSGGDGAAIASCLRRAGVPHAVVGRVGGSARSRRLSLGGRAGLSLSRSVPRECAPR